MTKKKKKKQSPYFWIGDKYKVERADAPTCNCPVKARCGHYAPGNKPSRRMLRMIAKMQNSPIGQKLLNRYDVIARGVPRGSHPHVKRLVSNSTSR